MLKSLYVDGETLLHRASAGAKMAALALCGIALYLTHSMIIQAAAFVLFGTVYLRAGLDAREAFARLKPVLFTVGVLGLINWWVLGFEDAAVQTLRILAIVFLAAAITATTRVAEFMALIEWLLGPLDRRGLVRAADVSLALGLVLRFVPDIFAQYEGLKEAHVARGIPFRPMKAIGPLIILVLKDADSIAEAIDARGIRGL